MIWGEYRKNGAWKETDGEDCILVTEGGTCIYCSRVYIAKFSGKKLISVKNDMKGDDEFATLFRKFRTWVIMEQLHVHYVSLVSIDMSLFFFCK